jgi:Lar family restriction alleviation protein
MQTELKPCPFCGGPAGLHQSRNYKQWYGGCKITTCMVDGPQFTNQQEAIQAWNNRVST